MTDRKLIAGVLHKRVKCRQCRCPIWVAFRVPVTTARCTDCRGTDAKGSYVTKPLAGRGELPSVSERQYSGSTE